MMMAGGGSILGSAALGQMQGVEPNEVMVGAMGGMLIALLVAFALLIPLLMAYWFAPALVVLRNMSAMDAMKLSFVGCLRNMWPFTIFGVISFILMMVAMIPFGLGMLILVPVLNASIYLGYKDIFSDSDNSNSNKNPEKDRLQVETYHSSKDTLEEQSQGPIEEDMIRCATCKTYVPRSECIIVDGIYYCCEEHCPSNNSRKA
jgi:hypothetical protein